MTKQSPATKLLKHVWGQSMKATGFSWERLNHSMSEALSLAIGSGMTFSTADMASLSEFRCGYWIGDWEWVYSLAVAVENMTAIKSFEDYKGRKPFLADGVTFRNRSPFLHGDYITRQRERLTVGAEFDWKGLKLTVTSFNDEGGYLTACSYKTQAKGSYERKIDKRFKITNADLLLERAERKERTELLDKLTQQATDENRDAIVKALGVKTRTDYATLNIDKIRKVAKRFGIAA